MRIAIVSDIHDSADRLSSIIEKIKKRDCELVFALGDYTSPETFKKLAEADCSIYAVFGNMDEEKDVIEAWARNLSGKVTLRREMNRVKIADENYALTHFPEIAEKLLKSGMYRAVFYGHTHNPAQRREDDTLLANPGAVQDGNFGIYDSESDKFKIIKI